MKKSTVQLISRIQELGFTFEEAMKLRRIEMTLQRWAEAECGDSNDYCSRAIERDETTDKPFMVVHYHNENKSRRYPIADREKGALKRLAKIMANHPSFVAYHQGDCRGCMLYIVPKSAIRTGINQIVEKAKAHGAEITMQRLNGTTVKCVYYLSGCKEAFDVPESAAIRFLKQNKLTIPRREWLPIESYYTRGLAICD